MEDNRPGPAGFRGNQFCKGTSSFTPEDDAFILKHYRSYLDGYNAEDGMSTRDIARHIGHNRNSVVSRYHILKGRRRKGSIYFYGKTEDFRYQRIDKRPISLKTPGLAKTSFEDLDPERKYED